MNRDARSCIEFDKVSYDREADVLYLAVEGTEAVRWEEAPEGHLIRFDESGQVCGVTLISGRHILEAEGHITLTVPVPRFTKGS